MTKFKIVCALLVLCCATACNQQQAPQSTMETPSTTPKVEKLLRHIVLFKFKDSSSTAEIAKVEQAFLDLPSAIKEIHAFEWGTNNSPENLNKDFTHSFLVTFTSEKDRAVYLPHPSHLAFVEVLKPHLDDVLVLDYWTNA